MPHDALTPPAAATRDAPSHVSVELPLWTGDYYNEGVNDPGVFDKVREECGVFGVFGHPDAASLAYYGLHALQHRGQESAGICTTDGAAFHAKKGMGLVKEVFDPASLADLRGSNAIAHVRYSTAGESTLANAQPLVFTYREGDLAIATNGNLVNAGEIRDRLERRGSIFQATTDTEVIAHLIARSRHDDIVEAVKEALREVSGAYALLVMTRDTIVAAMDPHALRPFAIARLGDAVVFSSETCAFDTIGAKFVRNVRPGEMLVLDPNGIRSERFVGHEARRAVCSMEYVYFARPDSDVDGINIHGARKRMGRMLADEAEIEADVVTGVPDSSISAAIGYAERSGIPYELGLIKNRYADRTFIQPSQELREQGVKMKLSAVRGVVDGKRVVMVDDSIVRGTTSTRIVRLLRDAGATEVHVRTTSPPFQNPCFYGIDTPYREDLIASSKSVEEIRTTIAADTLHFLSKDAMLDAVGGSADAYNRGLCTACFDHDYPVAVEHDVAASGQLVRER